MRLYFSLNHVSLQNAGLLRLLMGDKLVSSASPKINYLLCKMAEGIAAADKENAAIAGCVLRS